MNHTRGVCDEGSLSVTHGCSKDHRPDLRQFLSALLCNREGIPLWAEAQDGNHCDTVGKGEAIGELAAALEPEELSQVVYVGDSARCTGPNLEKLEWVGLRFSTRLPDRFKASGELRRKAWAEAQWVELVRLWRRVARPEVRRPSSAGPAYRPAAVLAAAACGRPTAR